MRRLAKQDREDRVRSARDYQTITEAKCPVFTTQLLRRDAIFKMSYSTESKIDQTFGMYLYPSQACTLVLVIDSNHGSKETTFQLHKNWNRVGIYLAEAVTGIIHLTFKFSANCSHFAIWGHTHGTSGDSTKALGRELPIEAFSDAHLIPEVFYLDHSSPNLQPDKNPIRSDSIFLKKCAYCQRLLPLDPNKRLQLAFHKHAAKLSGHQNECRSCKKIRINDFFNPKRTSDQLHESSVITRERKVLLREPEILQEFKDRISGEGLRTYIWKKFEGKCFRCEKPVTVKSYQLDHTRPLAYLWPLDEHATCLCSKCNNFKKHSFPVDFYTPLQLKKLAAITGLSLMELQKKAVNLEQLNRMKENIVEYCKAFDPRTFRSIATKVKEIMPDEDLFEFLKKKDHKIHKKLSEELAKRPVSDDEDIE